MAAVSPISVRIAGERSDAERATVFFGGAIKFAFESDPDGGREAAERFDPVARPVRSVAP